MAAGEGVRPRAPMAAGEGGASRRRKMVRKISHPFSSKARSALNPPPWRPMKTGRAVRLAYFSDKLKRFTTVLTRFFRIVNALFPYVN